MGSSSALVCTPAANAGAVATYRSAGFRQLPDVPDLERSAWSTVPSAARLLCRYGMDFLRVVRGRFHG
jgi:hypothetical protein